MNGEMDFIRFPFFREISPKRQHLGEKLAKRNRKKKKRKISTVYSHEQSSANRIELVPNPSKFAVFSAIRTAVIETEAKSYLNEETRNSNKRLSDAALKQENDTDVDSSTADLPEKATIIEIPQIVGAGLKGLFEVCNLLRLILK